MPQLDPITVREIFSDAAALPAAQRKHFLDRACQGDSGLRARVQSLLDALACDEQFLAAPTVDPRGGNGNAGTGTGTPRADETIGTILGPYKLLELLGEGGFGTVYLAEQTEPVRRRVAIKVIKLGMDTRRVVARFEAERQALAMMDHPNIARVLDAGATETGRPYFVMELVKGLPITQYCDQHRVPLPERLTLFTDVCHAVQHAHQKGIIHRDLKPSNVLVSRHDDKPVVKVIDFGIAKATGIQLTDKTLHTEWRQLIGTPTYMSPEQAGLSDLDVDTRSDIYALGVLLYELLTGTTPFNKQALLSSGFDEMRRIIQEVEPPKPSTRLSSLLAERAKGAANPAMGASAASADDSSAQTLDASPVRTGWNPQSKAVDNSILRRTEVETQPRRLRGDLDWIVMKCLEKDRTRRYETANGLAADVERHRSGEPVVAAPPSATYRVKKFARRHKVGVIAGSSVLAALILGIIGTGIGLKRANAAQERERKQRELAEKREKETKEVAQFQAAMLSEVDVEAMGRGIKERFREQVRAALERQYVGEFPDRRKRTPEEVETEMVAFDERANAARAADVARRVMDEFVLARAADALEKDFAEQPLVKAQLHDAIGNTYRGLGLYDAAEPHLRAALETREHELGEDHLDLAPSLCDLSMLFHAKGDYVTEEPLIRKALALSRKRQGDEHLFVAPCLNNLALLLDARGEHAAAEPLMRESLEITRKAYGDEHPKVASSLNSLGVVLRGQRKHAEAESLFRESLTMRRKLLGDHHIDVANSMNSLANSLSERGEYAAAEALYTEALTITRKMHGDEHRLVALLLSNLGNLFGKRNDFARAELLYEEALAMNRKVLGEEHPEVALNLFAMAALHQGKRDPGAAEPLFREAIELQRKRLGEHPQVANSLDRLAELLADRGDHSAAEERYREALNIRRKLLGVEHPDVALSLINLSELFAQNGDRDAVNPLLYEVLALSPKLRGDAHPNVATAMGNLAELLRSKVDDAAAEPVFRAALELACDPPGSDRAVCAFVLHHLADDLRALHQFDEAEKLAREAVKTYQASADPSPRARREYTHAVDILSKTLVEACKPDEAVLIEREFIADFRRLVPACDPLLATELTEFGRLLIKQKQYAEAEPIMLESLEIRRRQPAGNVFLQDNLAEIGLMLLQLDRYADAEPILRELLEIREMVLKPDSKDYWKLPNVRSMLGGALVGQGAALIQSDAQAAIAKFTEAEPLLVESGKWLTQNGERIPENLRAKRLREALERIVRLYEFWDTVAPDSGKADQAAKWRIELHNLPGP